MRNSIVVLLGMLLIPSVSWGASLKICYDNGSVDPSAATIRADATPPSGPAVLLYADVLAGSVVTGSKRCSTQPYPSTLTPGTTYGVTLVGINSLGQGGAASNAVTFLAPAIPGVITGVTIQAVVP